MHITSTATDPYTLDAHIVLERTDLEQYIRQAKEMLSKEAVVGGFRKGKAPQHLVEQHVGRDAVRAEALQLALEGSFSVAAKQQGWDVAKTGDLKIDENSAERLQYGIRVFLWPPVRIADLTMIRVPRKKGKVSDAEIVEAIDALRNMRATFLEKTGPATSGDRVEVDFDASLSGKPVEGGQSRNHPLVIGGKTFMPGFEEELVGLTAGQTKQFSLTAPADYYEPRLAGKKVDFSVTMRRVQTVLKPAADDEFARSLGRFTSLEQLRGNVHEGLQQEKDAKEKQRLRLAILDAVIAASEIPAPASMTTEELGGMLERFAHDLRGRGIELPLYLARLKKTEEELRRDWLPEAERQVRIGLILRTVAKEKSMSVPDDEVEEALSGMMTEAIRQGQVTEEQIDPQRLRTAITERLLTDKTLDFIEGVCAV